MCHAVVEAEHIDVDDLSILNNTKIHPSLHVAVQGLLLSQAAAAAEDSGLQDGQPAQVHWQEDNC